MILVVDDHRDTRQVLIRLLKLDGYNGVPAACGVEALDYLKIHKPRLVLLDYNMPGIDGLTVFRKMREDPRLADVSVIMFSAHDGELRDAALRAGVDSYVLKGSLDWSLLRREIQRFAGPGAASPVEKDFRPLPTFRQCGGK